MRAGRGGLSGTAAGLGGADGSPRQRQGTIERQRGKKNHLVRPLQDGNTSSSQHREGGAGWLQGTALSPARSEEHAQQWMHTPHGPPRTRAHSCAMSAQSRENRLSWCGRSGMAGVRDRSVMTPPNKGPKHKKAKVRSSILFYFDHAVTQDRKWTSLNDRWIF